MSFLRPFAAAVFALSALEASLPAEASRANAPLQIVTFNAGLTKLAKLIEFVPCVESRVAPQLEALSKVLRPPFVLNVQELWSDEVKGAYWKWARDRGYSFASGDYGTYDLVTISSEPILSQRFKEFERNYRFHAFGYLVSSVLYDGRLVDVINAHTGYSRPDELKLEHVAQLEELAALTRSRPRLAILAGDLNTGPDHRMDGQIYDPVEELWRRSWLAHLDPAWVKVGGDRLGPTWDVESNLLVSRPTLVMSGGNLNCALDHVYVSPDFEVLESRVELNQRSPIADCGENSIGYSAETGLGRTHLSDHYAVEALVRLR